MPSTSWWPVMVTISVPRIFAFSMARLTLSRNSMRTSVFARAGASPTICATFTPASFASLASSDALRSQLSMNQNSTWEKWFLAARSKRFSNGTSRHQLSTLTANPSKALRYCAGVICGAVSGDAQAASAAPAAPTVSTSRLFMRPKPL